jgi:hypothetical protein
MARAGGLPSPATPKRCLGGFWFLGAPSGGPACGQGAPRQAADPAKASEQKLIAALQASPGASERALATAVGANRSQTGERLRKLAAAGAVAKGGDGRWRLTADLAGEEARPTQPSPAAS